LGNCPIYTQSSGQNCALCDTVHALAVVELKRVTDGAGYDATG
jgi:hypothetical protein